MVPREEQTPPTKAEVDPTQRQAIGNLTPIRFQMLADELKQELEAIPSLKNKVERVFFLPTDTHEPPKGSNPQKYPRYYNARLVKSFDLPKRLADWIRGNRDSSVLPTLFEVAAELEQTPNQWERFKRFINAEDYNPAYELLVSAFAVIPYTGLLPGAWDLKICNKGYSSATDEAIGTWWTYFVPGRDYTTFKSEKTFAAHRKREDVERKQDADQVMSVDFPKSFLGERKGELEKLIKNIVNYFVLNAPLAENPSEESPYEERDQKTQNSNSSGTDETSFLGPVIPLYDHYCGDAQSRPLGGFSGWLLIDLKDKEDPQECYREWNKDLSKKDSRTAFTFAIRNFADRIRGEQVREIIESEWSRNRNALEFAKDKFRHYGGWEPADVTEDLIKIANDKLEENPKRNYYKFISNGKDTYFIIRLRDETLHKDTRICIFKKRHGTVIDCETNSKGSECTCREAYARKLARALEDIYEAARLREVEKEAGKSSGFLRSAHDYSKELNVLDSQLAQFRDKLDHTKTSILDKLKDSPELEAYANEQFAELSVPQEQWLLRARFLMAHKSVVSDGIFHEQPDWCVNLIEQGTRRALYKIIRLLVWHPVGWQGYVDLSRDTGEDDTSFLEENLDTWARLFAYDETGRHAEIDKLLGTYMRKLFVQKRISREAFSKMHPPPKLNPDQTMDTNLLWAPLSSERWRPAGRLLPLLVFSLRTAFQHAWLTTFIKAAKAEKDSAPHGAASESITLTAHESISPKVYELSITFPDPREYSQEIKNMHREPDGSLPWGDAERQLEKYQGMVNPWNYSLSKRGSEFIITIQA